jgi:PAS domain S-box-containing protein
MLAAAASPRVLIVDDNPGNLTAFEAILWDGNFDLVSAQSGAEAMRQLLLGDFAAILLDINMPSLDGIETAKLIRARERSRDVPIIFITAHQPDQEQMLKGYASGAVDYLVKPVLPEILRFKVRVFVDLFRKTKQIEWQAAQLRAVNARLQDEIAQRKEAERDAAFEREERQRVALASIADAVIATDAQGTVVSLNPMAEQLCEYTNEAARGRPLSEILDTRSVEAQDPPEEALRRCIVRDETIRARQPVELMHGRRAAGYIAWSVAPVHDRLGNVVGAMLIVQDVTDRHRAELGRTRALRQEKAARRAAEQANRARDEFLAVISHELRTPLNAIVGWTQILRTRGASATHAEQAVEAIHRSAMAQKKLIEDLLDMSRIINGKIELAKGPVDLAAVVVNAIDTLRPLIDAKHISVECALESGVPPVHADRARLEQVIWNVLANAVKFTPNDGRIGVRLQDHGDRARLTVNDSGEGIARTFLPHVFDAFRQADSTTTRRQGGLGLGLAIARQLVNMHHGSIEAHSDGPGSGATFVVSLPLTPDALAAPGASGKPRLRDGESQRDLRQVRVLIVDDDADTLEMMSILAEEAGAEVKRAPNAREALRLLREWLPDVLLSDISMPDEDGFALIRRVRALPAQEGGHTPAAAITAMASDEDRARVLTAGFQAHIPKPLEFDALVQAIASLLRPGVAGDTLH